MNDQITETTDIEQTDTAVSEPAVEPDTAEETPAPDAQQPEAGGLNEGGAKALRRERDARKAAEAEAKRLRDELAARDRADIIRTYELPDELAGRLVGDSLDDLDADAQRLASLMKNATDGGVRRRPTERLRSGTGIDNADPDEGVVDRILSRGRF